MNFANAPSIDLLIDDRDHDDAMALALSKRHKSHKSTGYICTQPWKQDVESCGIGRATMASRQKEFIRKHRGLDPERLELTSSTPALSAIMRRLDYDTKPDPSSVGPRTITPDELSTPQASRPTGDTSAGDTGDDTGVPDNGASVSEEELVITSPAKNRKVNFHNCSFTSQGKEYDFDLPVSHTIVHGTTLTKLKQDREKLERMKEATKMKRFTKNPLESIRPYLATALAAVPSFAITAAGFIIPLFVACFLTHYGLIDHVGNAENFTQTFPSASYLRENMFDEASHNLVWMAHELDDKKVYLSCDKGKFYCACCLLLCQRFRLTSCCCYP